MKRIIHIITAVLLCSGTLAQQDSAVVEAFAGLSGPGDQIASCMASGDLLMLEASSTSMLLSDFPGQGEPIFRIVRVKLDSTTGTVQEKDAFFSHSGSQDDGSIFFHEKTDTYWFSSANNFGLSEGRRLKLFSVRLENGKMTAPQPFIHNSNKYDICHPWLHESGNRLFFSSNRSGGSGSMDIWYCNMLVDGWSQPIWAGEAVNSPGNEVFPTMFGDSLYFSSDGHQGAEGLDIYQTSDESQWKSVRPMPQGINSSGDDFQLIFQAPGKGLMTSNRNGEGDDILSFSILAAAKNQERYEARLVCRGAALQGELVKVFNGERELLLTEETNADGAFDASFMQQGELYEVFCEQLSPVIAPLTYLYILDSEGTLVQMIPINTGNAFKFEMLPTDASDLPLLSNPDESILTVDLEGQLYSRTPGDVGRGEAVYISSAEGELLALTYTSTTGRFQVDNLRPLKEYQIQVEDDSRAQNILFEEDGQEVTIPLVDHRAEYERLQEEEAIEILDEYDRPIQISESDVFIVKNIYYRYDSADLNKVAQSQLSHLGTILRNNPEMNIELSSHTDSRGKAAYNLALSERRAQAAVAFLMENGIEASRLQAIGYGETQLINQCADNEPCSEAEHALNRRTELRILFE